MSNTHYFAPIDRPGDKVDDAVDSVGSTPFEDDPMSILGDEDDNTSGAPVRVENDYLVTTPRAANSGSTGQSPVGDTGQRRVSLLIGRQAARRSVQILNTGSVEVEFGFSESLMWGNGFPLAVGAAEELDYRGPIWFTVAQPEGVAPGSIAWIALHEDG